MFLLFFIAAGIVFNVFVTPRLWNYLISGYEAERASVMSYSTVAAFFFPFMATFFAFVYMMNFKLKLSFAPKPKSVPSAVQNPQPKEMKPEGQSNTQSTKQEVKPPPVVEQVDKGFLYLYPDDDDQHLM